MNLKFKSNSYAFIASPTGEINFSYFPAIEHKLFRFPAAPIRLQRGNVKWGEKHIQISHQKKLNGQGVARFIATILQYNASIYCEFEVLAGQQKPQVVNIRVGTVVLRYKEAGGLCFYTVVTAFSRMQAVGEKIGVLGKQASNV